MKAKDGGRNGIIELLRFLAAVSIALYHFEWICLGQPVYFQHFYIWVEFFFVISGFFCAINAINKKDTMDGIEYAFIQLKKLYPLYVVGFVFSFVIANITSKMPLNEWLQALWRAKWEIFLCTMYGFDNASPVYNRGGAVAYISTLLICTTVLYSLIKNYRKAFINIISPIVIVGGGGKDYK